MEMAAQQHYTAADAFRDRRYVYLNSTISRKDCEELTKYMFSLYDKGVLEKDEQCPLSDSVYGDEIFDGIARELAGPLSNQLGVQLLPTYTYARIYRNGEILVRHKDRPSCEISGTMTLGFDDGSGLWPIYFAENDDDQIGTPYEINIGDLVMYRGCELPHWRPKYKGKWQVQIFFHFVDANGPHKDFVWDGRKTMGKKKTPDNLRETPTLDMFEGKEVDVMRERNIPEDIKFYHLPQSQWITNGIMIRTCDNEFPGASFFSKKGVHPEMTLSLEECKRVISYADQKYGMKSTVGSDESRAYNKEIREVDTYTLEHTPETSWLFQKVAAAVGVVNAEYYRWNLLGITHALQLLHYKGEDKSHYQWHIDAGPTSSATRKLSLSIPLNDDYEGGDLIINSNGVIMTAPKELGSISFFPSFSLHKVEPVTKGERWVIVAWIHGPDRFK